MNPYALESLFILGAVSTAAGLVAVMVSGLAPKNSEEALIQYGFTAMLVGGVVMALCGIIK